MEREHSQAINEHKTMVKQLNKKTDTSLDNMKQQHVVALAKVFSTYILNMFFNNKAQIFL